MEKKTNVPKLRFPEFEGEWVEKKLGEIAEINPKSGSLPNSFIYIDLESVVDGQLLKEERIELVNAPSRAQRLLSEGDILFQMVRPYQKNNLYFDYNGEYVASTGYAQIRTNNNPQYIYQYIHFQQFTDKVIERCTGTSYPAINSTDLSNIRIAIPILPEQTKIASFLTAADDKLTQLKKKKSLLEEYKKGVMQKIFSQELRFKDDNGEDFPEWEEKSLGGIGETFNGLSGKTKEDFGLGKPYIQYKQIFDDSKIDISRFGFVDIGDNENQNRVQFGDVFFTISSETPNEIGTASVLLDKVDDLYLNSFCFGYRASSLEILNPYFSRYLFRNELFRNEIVKLAQGSTRYNMSKTQLLRICVSIPSLPEQTKIANFLSAIDEKINHCSKQIERMEEWKKGLLQQMFC
ncbi:restriction endonuclease subunit S [Bacteroides luti]|nr:restriction endonuclease subunit S [Bacteroides luti]